MEKELTKEEAEQLTLEAINYLIENKEDAKISEEVLMKVFKQGIFVNLIRLYKEKAMYACFYILYYLKTLGDTTYYEKIFDEAFESINFEKKIFKFLKEELKTIKENKNYEKLIPFYEVIQELLKLDKNRENILVRDLELFCQMMEGNYFSVEYPIVPSNKEMEKNVIEKVKTLNPNQQRV